MIKFYTGCDLAAEVHMLRAGFTGSILIVEGETDKRLMTRFVEVNYCRILVAYGKENALEAIDNLEDSEEDGFLAVLDADFWHITEGLPSKDHVLVTDDHDLDVMLFMSKATSRLIDEYASRPKTVKFLRGRGAEDIRLTILKICEPIGILRWVSARDCLQLVFEGLKFKAFVEAATLNLEIEKLVEAVLRNSSVPIRRRAGLIREISKTAGIHPLRQICNGHDVIELLAIGLRRAIGSRDAKTAAPSNVASLLRLAFGHRDFFETQLYQSIRDWERQHSPFRVLGKE